MRNFKIKVYFKKDILIQPEIVLVKNDYNSTEFEFEFDIQDGKKVFELKKPDGTVWIKDIVDNKIVLVDFDDEENIIPIINQAGPYSFEIVCYDENSKITSTQNGKFSARDEVVDLDEDKLSEDARLPILDSLINQTMEATKESKEQGDYAKSQGDYAKEQAQKVIDSNNEATKIINSFESNVDNYTSDFNKNADNKLKSYNQNDTVKTNSYNENASSKLKEYNDNHEEKITDYNKNAVSKKNEYNTNHTNKLKTYNDNDTEKVEAYNSNHDSKLSDYNTNVEAKLSEYNSNHEEKMNAYNENHDIKMNEFNSEIDDIKSDLEDCYNNQLVGQASGTSIQVKDSADARLRSLEIDGALEQETTKGKNLLNYTNIYSNRNGLATILNSDGSLTTSGVLNSNYTTIIHPYNTDDILEDGKTYTISQKNANNKLYIQLNIKNKETEKYTYLNLGYNNLNSTSFIVDKSLYTYTIVIQSNSMDFWGTENRSITNFYQLEEGDAATDFEKYTGGQASPSPEYPQEIEVLEAENLLPYPYTDTTKTENGITFSDNGDGTITLNGTATGNVSYNLFGHPINNQKPILGKYISGGINTNISIRAMHRDNGIYHVLAHNNNGNWQEINLSTYQDGYIEIFVRKGTVCDNVVVKPMLTKTNNIKNYIPFGCIQIKVLSGNLYNYQDIDLAELASAISVDEDGWVTITYDNSDGEKQKYINFWVRKNNFLKTNTQYNLILEIKEVSGTGRLLPISTATGYTGQFLTSVGYNFSNLLSGNIYKNLITTRDNFNDSSTITRSYVQFLPGESGSITFRLSVLEDTTITPEKFKYVPYQEETVDINLQGNFVGKINDEIKDTLRIENGHAILNKKVDKERLMSNNVLSFSDEYKRFSWININSSKSIGSEYVKSNFAICKTNTTVNAEYKNTIIPRGRENGGHILYVWLDNVTNIDEAKEFLDNNEMYVYYILKEPYDVDLGTVKLPKIFKGVSNIFLNANLETNMKVEYVKDTQLAIDNLQSQIDNINTLLSTTNTSALLLDNLQSDLESEVI